MRIIAFISVFFVLSSLIAEPKTNTYIESASNRDKTAEAIRIPKLPIILDGKLDDTAWKKATQFGHFTQREPHDGMEPTYQTFFRVTYDNEYLYVGIEAFDDEPDKIRAILTRRDEYTRSDWVYVSLDSYDDNRTAFEFGLNAAGVKHDLRRFDDNNADFDWDAVWDGAVDINDHGWSAEFKIPFRELRFTNKDQMSWGLQVYREFPRNDNELSVWNYWSQEETGFVSKYGTLEGISEIQSAKPLYVAPYIVGKSNISSDLKNSVHPERYDLSSNMGGDIRYSFSNGLTFNATVNPDFGQVESDPADYNLTNFETYFSEKRPFFMEGGNIFNFSLGFGDGDMQSQSLFYSRRIGRTPQLSLDDYDRDYISKTAPEATNIITAAKLTGKTQNGYSLGIMNAVTTEETGSIIFEDRSRENQVLEPMTNYFLGRVQRDYRNGNTTLGGMISSVNRRLEGTNITNLRSEAYTGGIDMSHQFGNENYMVQAAVAFSRIGGTREAILRTQSNPTHYFQRPDASHLRVDSSATVLSGWGEKLILAKTGGGHIRAATGIIGTSPGFEVNDLGFYPRVDQQNQFAWMQYYQWEPSSWYNEYRININQWSEWTNEPERTGLGGNINAHFTLKNNWRTGMGITHNRPGLMTAEMRGGPAIRYDSRNFLWGYIETDSRKNFQIQLFTNGMRASDGVKMHRYSVDFIFRPRQNLQLSLEPSISILDDTWSWSTKTELDDGSYRYIFADMIQQTFATVFRMDYTIRPNLSIQYYAQPFVTAGDYSGYKVVTDPRASNFEARFHTYTEEEISQSEGEYFVDMNRDGTTEYSFNPRDNFNFKQFRSNLVVRWEYVTGSVLYLVWSQGYDYSEDLGTLRIDRDMRSLFNTPGNNVLLLKFSYLLNL